MCILVLHNESSMTVVGDLQNKVQNFMKKRALLEFQESETHRSLGLSVLGQLLQTAKDSQNNFIIGFNCHGQTGLKDGNISENCVGTQIDEVECGHYKKKDYSNLKGLVDNCSEYSVRVSSSYAYESCLLYHNDCDPQDMESGLETRSECPSELAVDKTWKNGDQVWQDAESMSSQNDASRYWLESVSSLDPDDWHDADKETCGEVVVRDSVVPGQNTTSMLDAGASGAGASGAGASGAGASGAGASGAGASGAGASGAGASGAGASGAGASGAGTSGAGTSGAGTSGAGTSGAGTSGAGAFAFWGDAGRGAGTSGGHRDLRGRCCRLRGRRWNLWGRRLRGRCWARCLRAGAKIAKRDRRAKTDNTAALHRHEETPSAMPATSRKKSHRHD
ncbi:uncharacterized protein [Procambarus clarkii]|uniref:uncharacterized protein n=1 Tax=Procambarus clarkii TaxID=6728 RepID=UPI001E677F41|nr:RNA-binding protein FUS-like [Procambarus clarkii]